LDYEQGFIDSDEFLSHYRNQFPELANSEVKKIWNSMLIDFPKYRLDFIEQLAEKNKFKLILLSNTNDWHIAWVQENFKDYKRFENCFDAFYLSHEMGMRKPNPEIFDYVLNQHNLNAEETLFIDDTSQNTKAAGEIGMHTWNIDPKTEDVIELFSQKSKLF
jgi:putative hydrolase of the HAD superfamily